MTMKKRRYLTTENIDLNDTVFNGLTRAVHSGGGGGGGQLPPSGKLNVFFF